MLLLTLSLLLAAEPPSDLKLAAPGLNTSGIEASVAGPLTDHLAQAFTAVRVVTPRDISALLGLERQKQLLGCADDAANCMAELGNALGVQGVLLGDIVKLGKAVQINVRIIDPVGGRELGSSSARVESEEEIFDALTRCGTQLQAQFFASMGRAAPAAPAAAVSTRGGGTRRFFPVPLAVGGAALAAGIGLLVAAESGWQRLTQGAAQSLTLAEAQGIARDGKLFQVLGATLTTVGVAAALSGVGLLIFGSAPDQPAVSVSLSGNGVVLVGAF